MPTSEMLLSLLTILLGCAYTLAATVIALYSASFFILLAIYAITRCREPQAAAVSDDELLSVTLQLPVYNERHVVERLIDAVGALDYPRDKLVIQVLDDSIDDTTALLRRKVRVWQAKGLTIHLIRRPDRTGYKAGALAYGLAQTDTDCVGVFDADFVPAPDFLRRVMPHFNADPDVALVQTRWDHLNTDYNPLTRAQALALDQHFAIEQIARNRGELPMTMNGTGGIWRRDVIESVGGWSGDTLTEDMDLSYRAFLRGWRFRYLVDVSVPGEIPPHLTAYKIQQARWAKGSTQCLVKHIGPLLRADLSLLQKVFGLTHLGQYMIQPFVLLMFLLTPPILLTDLLLRLPLGPLGIAGIAPVLVIVLGQTTLHRNWPRRLLFFPVLTLVSTGLMLNNTRAVFEALTGRGGHEFKRTPKFCIVRQGDALASTRYIIRPDWTTAAEIGLGLYAIVGLGIALVRFPAMAGYMALYVLSFGLLAFTGLWQNKKQAPVRRNRGLPSLP